MKRTIIGIALLNCAAIAVQFASCTPAMTAAVPGIISTIAELARVAGCVEGDSTDGCLNKCQSYQSKQGAAGHGGK